MLAAPVLAAPVLAAWVLAAWVLGRLGDRKAAITSFGGCGLQ